MILRYNIGKDADQMDRKFYNEIKTWMYQNARPIDLGLWQYFFEDGDKKIVVEALMNYQNEDGGFGHALEADNWNPNSTPITTQHALKILRLVDFLDMRHPIYQGIWKYLNAEKDLLEYGWRFTVPSNEDYPHAPWWNYSEAENKKEYFGVTAELTAFILKYGEQESSLYQKALKFTDQLINLFIADKISGDMGIKGYITLIDTLKELGVKQYDEKLLKQLLQQKVNESIEHDIDKWQYYGKRPSDYIHSSESVFYSANAEIVQKELQYLIDTKPENDVWGITWTWFDNMEKYSREFAISENWWKGYCVIEKMLFLRAFDKI